MPIYHKLGQIPSKRHVQFRKPDGGLYYEQLFGTVGFAGMSSLLYHHHRPTRIAGIDEPIPFAPTAAVENNMTPRRLLGFRTPPVQDYLKSRSYVLFNSDVNIALAAPSGLNTSYFYKNADADELVFVHQGSGTLETMLGHIPFESGDYLLIPRGIIHRFAFSNSENRLLITESNHPIYTPKRYRNYFGQLLEHSPFCERDMKLPSVLEHHDEKGDFLVYVKKQGLLHPVHYQTHPFDVVGWDGYNFPYGFSIHNFEPITGRVHQPPPVHQTFETDAFVVCSFCPRLYDYHPQSIPAPYNHSNIDSDEVLYYVDGDFMSRNEVEKGMITLHPAGIPHGPQPGAAERSIGQTETNELAVMIDTFKPLKLTAQALNMEDPAYWASWQE
ncbi:MAG: homogentisate 1,2-dioxygenase [Bacteroidetes bacterium]|nr:homogentisate 1,2-dioxygenase [Bacteroidota bacterium]MDA0931786.1 homogentisate 1,2-dioxygenase [Bacteroidota bacterium]